MCHGRGRSNATGESAVWLRRFDHSRSCAIAVVLAVPAGVDILHMLGNRKLSRYHNQLFGDLLADDMPLMAAGTGQLFLWKAVLDHCLRQALQVCSLLLFALGALVSSYSDQLRFGSERLCIGLGFIENVLEKLQLILVRLLAGPAKSLGGKQADLSLKILQPLEGLGQFSLCLESAFLPGIFGWIWRFSCVFHTQYFAS